MAAVGGALRQRRVFVHDKRQAGDRLPGEEVDVQVNDEHRERRGDGAADNEGREGSAVSGFED